MSSLRGRQVGPEDFSRFDLILAADAGNRADLEAMRPAGNETPVRLLASYDGASTDSIPDPYKSGDFTGALDLIERACGEVIAQLQ